MTEEARQTIDELRVERRKAQRKELARNALMISSSLSTVIMAVVLWFVTSRLENDTTVYVEEAQQTVREACAAAEGKALPVDTKRDCEAADRGELPQVLQSVVDNPDPDDPESQDREIQDPENQDPEFQDSETQEPEIQDPEEPDSETNDPDPVDDPDPDDPEINDPDPDDPEIQDEEIQEPEQQNAPVCPDGYTQQPFHYFGPDGVDNTGDEEDWILCKKVG